MASHPTILNDWFRRACRTIGIATFATAGAFSTVQADNGVNAQEIVLGQSSALSGPLGELGKDGSTAAKAYFDYINQQGGVNGRKIRLITLDDAYDTKKALENVKTLVEKENVFALFSLFGTPANTALMPIITQYGIPSIAPYTGSQIVRAPHNRLVFNVRASYADETEKIVEFLAARGVNKLAVAYQNNTFGNDGLVSVEGALLRRKLKLHAKASIENDSSNAAAAAKTIAAAEPQAVVMVIAGKVSVDFIKAYKAQAVGAQLYGLSVMGTQNSVDALGKDGVGVVVSQVVPFPFMADNAVVREYQQIMGKMGIKNWSFTSMEGFLNAKVTVDGLKAAGRDLTRERFIAAMEGMGKVDYDGYRFAFGKANHLGSNYVDLAIISKDGRFVR